MKRLRPASDTESLSRICGKTVIKKQVLYCIHNARTERYPGMKEAPESNKQDRIARLVLLAKNGNENAVSDLLNLYDSLIESLINRYSEGLSEEDRRDLRQEAAIAFCRALDRYHPEEGVAFGHFAKICVENRLIDCRRKSANDPTGQAVPLEDSGPSLSLADDDPARDLLERESYLALCERIRELLSDYENRIWMLVMAGRTPREIATIVGSDRKSVENAVARVRRKLRKALPR